MYNSEPRVYRVPIPPKISPWDNIEISDSDEEVVFEGITPDWTKTLPRPPLKKGDQLEKIQLEQLLEATRGSSPHTIDSYEDIDDETTYPPTIVKKKPPQPPPPPPPRTQRQEVAQRQNTKMQEIKKDLIIEGNTIQTFGKHKGSTYIIIYNFNPGYCDWFLKQKDYTYEGLLFRQWIERMRFMRNK